MRPIAPRTGAKEITIAEDQTQYMTLTGALYKDGNGNLQIVTRWTFTEEERRLIAAGEDLYLRQLTFGTPMQPISPQVGREGLEVPHG